MSELKRYDVPVGFEANVEMADGEYYLADDVDKRIEELEQRNKELRQALERSNYLLRGYKAQMHSFKLSEVIDEHIVTNERLLKGGE